MAIKICSQDDVALGSAVRVVIDGVPIALVRDSAGTVHAIGDTCSHADISLSEGFVEDETIECWAHGSRFSLTTGAALTLPAFEPVPVFAVSVEDGDIYIDPTPIYVSQKEVS